MQKTTIKKLLYKETGTHNSIKLNKKCLSLSNKVIKLEQEIVKMLDEKAKIKFYNYLKLSAICEGEIFDFYYVKGFKIGLNIGVECNKKSCN